MKLGSAARSFVDVERVGDAWANAVSNSIDQQGQQHCEGQKRLACQGKCDIMALSAQLKDRI